MHPSLATFIDRMDALVAASDDPHEIVARTDDHLADLLRHPEFLEEDHRAPGEHSYRQHVVHVHPEGRYSIVSLVWEPGQATPIHDHRCWCVVGVLDGRERESRYALHAEHGKEWLAELGTAFYEPGDVCRLVPPDEDIHRVGNASGARTISMHIYGANIAEVGTSVNRVFDQPIRTVAPSPGSTRVSWRKRDHDGIPVAAKGRI